ncbi:MAG: hypothetical protein GF398_11870 [Chitinivibrionales bacterium]|nr:hypothetical protein [Chitinivibrionales bacterium]
MKHQASLILISLAALCSSVTAEEPESTIVLKPKIQQYNFDAMPKDPLASMLFSATLPASGQLYNKEYLRAGIIAGIFYTGYFIAQYQIGIMEEHNTETFSVLEYDPNTGGTTGYEREITYVKPLEDWKWPSKSNRALFVISAGTTLGTWIYNIVDAYRGARKYNDKLIAFHTPKLDIAYTPQANTLKLSTTLTF